MEGLIRTCRLKRMLEGECFQFDSTIWFVKGFQHPNGYVVAYPRYSILTKTKTIDFRRVYWDCIKQYVPVIPLSCVNPYMYSLGNIERELALKLFMSCSGLSEENVIVTGSSVVGFETGDLDIVVYGIDESGVEEIHRSLISCFKPISEGILVRDYFEKHVRDTDLATYLFIKRNTRFHYMYGKLHVNVKYVFFNKGSIGCIDPVESYSAFRGYVEVVDSIRKYSLPAIYVAKHNGREIYLWSLREIYAEIPEGPYYIEGRLEKRSSGLYIVPDNGWLSRV